jgi:hypothetical protein
MPIIGTLPNNIQNGNTVDATPVMADFNFIVNQVNANANPSGTLTAPSGTRTLFHQPGAPVGWVTDATITDHTIQVQTATGGGVGGAVGYSAMFNSQWTTDGHALSIAELAVHSHTDSGHTHTDSGHNHVQNAATWYDVSGGPTILGDGSGFTFNTATLGTNNASAAIQTSFANITNTGSGSAHSHTKTFNALFVQMIMCQKS